LAGLFIDVLIYAEVADTGAILKANLNKLFRKYTKQVV